MEINIFNLEKQDIHPIMFADFFIKIFFYLIK